MLYIGSTDQLARRIRVHGFHGPRSAWTSAFGDPARLQIRFSVAYRRGDHLAREYRLIHRLRPQFNARQPRR